MKVECPACWVLARKYSGWECSVCGTFGKKVRHVGMVSTEIFFNGDRMIEPHVAAAYRLGGIAAARKALDG
jgi:hypothetical protein